MVVTIIVAGKNDIACNVLKYLTTKEKDENKILALPNENDSGIDNWQKSFKKTALDNNVKIIDLKDAYKIENSIFLSCEFDKIINPNLFATKKIYNIHFSKLPQYKGMYTSCLPILLNEKETGVTLHEIDKGIDTGDIIDQITFPILPEDVALDLYKKYTDFGFKIFINNINKLISGKYISYKQPIENSSYYSLNSVDFNSKIDYRKTAQQIKNQIHARSFIHFQLPKFKDISIIRAEIINCKSMGKIGEIVEENDEYIIINSIDYNVKLFKWV
tara:strand:- start:904 stop:1725 length:822 start_codon:yes stop_codon:yes gene_type:complete